ncbi:Poly(ADP-ribose) glycohydrolase 1 [Capsicum annuum]|nr:Poly(ADP-ribose) glycohydrolase 1 [Capsicum annuum]
MINPELIAGMLFLPCMADNEAIEIVGTERFSNYTGYASSFRFNGDHVDKKEIDVLGRRKRRIISIDALSSPGKRQYLVECLLRAGPILTQCWVPDLDSGDCPRQLTRPGRESLGNPSTSSQTIEETLASQLLRNHEARYCSPLGYQQEIGVVTGNWGCGAFGGDPQVKAVLQWLAASQALRPFVLYYTFDLEALQMLGQVVQWISSQGWTVGELWNMLVEYSVQRLRGETGAGFFSWLLPSLKSHDIILLNISHNV